MTVGMAELPETLAGEGQVLAGRYELLGLLGTGGMGSVYRARDRELDEIVALKMLRADLVSAPGMLGRFRQEAKLARKVTHENVARTFDIGEHHGAKFLTMEYIDGESLGTVLERERRLPLGRVVQLVEGICAGLTAAHAAGVVHRDLMRDNFIVGRAGRVVVTDFGIARAVSPDAKQTLGLPVGTPFYMAPEQVEASPNIDARADIYALGAMLFELLTGVVPWDGDSAFAIAARRLSTPPPDPRRAHPGVPDAVARILMRCMARKPDDRYATAREVAAAFASVTLAEGAVSSSAVTVRTLPPPDAPSLPSVTHTAEKTLAVLPFRNGGPPEDEYLADGLTEDLIDTLSMTREVRVRSRGAVMRFRGADGDPKEIGRQLDVHVVADGSVRRNGDQLRVAVKLVSVDDGFQLWAKRFDRPAREVMAIADEAAAAIADVLTIDWRAPARLAPTDPVALDLFMRARHEIGKRGRDATRSALALFEQAKNLAPNDPTILAHYAMALARMYSFGVDPGSDTFADKAREVALRVIAERPDLGVAHLALATIQLYTGDPAVALREARRAITLSPMLPEAHDLFGRTLIEAGAVARGVDHLRTAMKLDPRLEQLNYEIGRTLALEGRWAECDALFTPPPADPGLLNHYWTVLMRLSLWRRDPERARLERRQLEGDELPLKAEAAMALEVAETGVIEPRARDALARMIELSRTKRLRSFFTQIAAELYARAGERERTLEQIERAAAFDLFDITWIDRCPLFDDLRTDARFVASREVVAGRASAILEALRTSA